MTQIINTEYDFEQVVYLKMDVEQNPRMVTAIKIRPGCAVEYGLTYATDETYHYGFEISSEKNVLLSCN